jgi:hypothetical protein
MECDTPEHRKTCDNIHNLTVSITAFGLIITIGSETMISCSIVHAMEMCDMSQVANPRLEVTVAA